MTEIFMEEPESKESKAASEVERYAIQLAKEQRLDRYEFVKEILGAFSDAMEIIVEEGGGPVVPEGGVEW